VNENNQINYLKKDLKSNITNLIIDDENLLQKEKNAFEQTHSFDFVGEISPNIFDSADDFFLF
jgi:hypothetical protein